MKHKKHWVVGKGIECHRCGEVTEERAHITITDKELSRPFYYARWYNCNNPKCATTLIMKDEDRVYNNNSKTRKFYRYQQQREERIQNRLFIENLGKTNLEKNTGTIEYL
jgi:hypothetical protein